MEPTQLERFLHALSSYWAEAGQMSAHSTAPRAEGRLERFIVKCALTFGGSWCPPLFYRSMQEQTVSNGGAHISPNHPWSPVWRSAVFRWLGDYVTHPDVLGLDFSMRNAIWTCSVAMRVSNLISAHCAPRCQVPSHGYTRLTYRPLYLLEHICKYELLANGLVTFVSLRRYVQCIPLPLCRNLIQTPRGIWSFNNLV